MGAVDTFDERGREYVIYRVSPVVAGWEKT
jgi:hypothetical protein